MPHFDGPYTIISTNEHHSTVTLDLPNVPNVFPVFHTSEIQPFLKNNDNLFPSRALNPPDPVLVRGKHEFYIDKIVDKRRRNKQTQYRIRWQGEGPEGNKWLPANELEECKALDVWQKHRKRLPKLVLRL